MDSKRTQWKPRHTSLNIPSIAIGNTRISDVIGSLKGLNLKGEGVKLRKEEIRITKCLLER